LADGFDNGGVSARPPAGNSTFPNSAGPCRGIFNPTALKLRLKFFLSDQAKTSSCQHCT
jgi:hypothetical protein